MQAVYSEKRRLYATGEFLHTRPATGVKIKKNEWIGEEFQGSRTSKAFCTRDSERKCSAYYQCDFSYFLGHNTGSTAQSTSCDERVAIVDNLNYIVKRSQSYGIVFNAIYLQQPIFFFMRLLSLYRNLEMLYYFMD